MKGRVLLPRSALLLALACVSCRGGGPKAPAGANSPLGMAGPVPGNAADLEGTDAWLSPRANRDPGSPDRAAPASPPAPATEADAFRGAWQRLDVDGDGSVDVKEWGDAAWAGQGRPAPVGDTNGDGQVSLTELADVARNSDPVDFDGMPHGQAPPAPWDDGSPAHGTTPMDIQVAFYLLSEQIRVVDPLADALSLAEVHRLAHAGDLADEHVRAAALRLSAAYRRAGLPFPAEWIVGESEVVRHGAPPDVPPSPDGLLRPPGTSLPAPAPAAPAAPHSGQGSLGSPGVP